MQRVTASLSAHNAGSASSAGDLPCIHSSKTSLVLPKKPRGSDSLLSCSALTPAPQTLAQPGRCWDPILLLQGRGETLGEMLVGARLSCCTHLLVLPLPPASRCLAGDERDAGITSKAARAIQHPPRIKGILHAGWERRCACCVHPSTKPPGGPGCSSTGCPGGSLGQGCSLLAGVCRAGQEVCNAAGCKGWLRGESSLPLSPTCLTSTSCCCWRSGWGALSLIHI